VPAYAVAGDGQPLDVAPSNRRRRVSTTPEEGVSREEFDDLVANLGVEAKPAVAPPRQRPAGGRRARSQQNGGEGDKPRKPRNTRHGRPR
jgi:hypothetical protein